MDVVAVRNRVHREVNAHRALHRLVDGPDFKDACSRDPSAAVLAKLEYPTSFTQLVQELNDWIIATTQRELGELPMTKLREIARKYKIPYYAQLSRTLLLSKIANEQAKEKEAQQNATQSVAG